MMKNKLTLFLMLSCQLAAISVTVKAKAGTSEKQAISGKNLAPVVTIKTPYNIDSITAPASLVLQANASDEDGRIAKVVFLNDDTLLAEATSEPYTCPLSNLPAGIYSITARAVDNLGAASPTAILLIEVHARESVLMDIKGSDCASANSSKIFEVNAADGEQATGYSWHVKGITNTINVLQQGKAEVRFGPAFEGATVFATLHFANPLFDREYSKQISVCPVNGAGLPLQLKKDSFSLPPDDEKELRSGIIYPTVSSGDFTFVARKTAIVITVSDVSGHQHLKNGPVPVGQKLVFGGQLNPGTYFVQAWYPGENRETIMIIKR